MREHRNTDSVPACATGTRFALGVLICAVLATSVGFFSCNTTDPPPPRQSSLSLEALDASCTEAWLRVRLASSAGARTVALERDGQRVLEVTMLTDDTLLVDEGLLPRRRYSYRALRMSGGNVSDASAPVQLTTMDTTSHNWVFDQPVLLGDGGGNVEFRDPWYLADASGNQPNHMECRRPGQRGVLPTSQLRTDERRGPAHEDGQTGADKVVERIPK